MVQVNLQHHLWLHQGEANERWYDAGPQEVTEAEAADLRGHAGVTFTAETVEAAPAAIPEFNFSKPAQGKEAERMDKELAAFIAKHSPPAVAFTPVMPKAAPVIPAVRTKAEPKEIK